MQTITTAKFCESQTIDKAQLTVSPFARMDYGERFRLLRKARFKGTVLELARQIGRGYPSTVYNIEHDWRVPNLPTLAKHAKALGCQPWELLEDVESETDRVRAIANLSKPEADRAWSSLLKRYDESVRRGQKKDGPAALARAAEREVARLVGGGRKKRAQR